MVSVDNIDWQKIADAIPVRRKKDSIEDWKKRKKMFKDFDPNGNGYLSLAELDKGIRDVLVLP